MPKNLTPPTYGWDFSPDGDEPIPMWPAILAFAVPIALVAAGCIAFAIVAVGKVTGAA